MGISGQISIVGSGRVLNGQTQKMAMHARPRLETITFHKSLAECLAKFDRRQTLVFATSSRVGSSKRPHPIAAASAVRKALDKMLANDINDLVLVFGSEANGLSNEEIALTDWIVAIPSDPECDSLNLAQSVLVFCYEIQRSLLANIETSFGAADKKSGQAKTLGVKPSQKQRVIQHFIEMAESVGFVLPGDPFKMKPRLEALSANLPHHIEGAETLHGLMDQVVRSVRKGEPDFKGRYKRKVRAQTPDAINQA
jgi:tRNA/rRNA methyltransferase